MRNVEAPRDITKPENIKTNNEAPQVYFRTEISLADHALRTTVRTRLDVMKEREEIIDSRPETD